MINLKNKKLFLFDIDGTIAVDNTLYDGAADLIAHIKSIGGKSFFITNNSTKSTQSYVEKFNDKFGLVTTPDQFVTAGYLTMLYLKEHYEGKKIFAVTSNSVVKEYKDFGLSITTTVENDIAAVLVAYDDGITYKKLYDACEILFTQDADFLATNPDLRCPSSFGFIPDCGALCASVIATTDKKPFYIGKPNKAMVELCIGKSGFSKQQTIVIGDRLYTDIQAGINAGVDTCAVLTGETTTDEINQSDAKPSIICENIRKFYELFFLRNVSFVSLIITEQKIRTKPNAILNVIFSSG